MTNLPSIRVGQGFDVHAFAPGRALVMGGVRIDFHLGLAGHSDADVLTHAIMDALLGAAGMGDIGKHFPDNDPAFKDADSIMLLERVMNLLHQAGWTVLNCDATIVAEAPRMSPHVPAMKRCLAGKLGIDYDAVNVKATTTEKLGFAGRGEGIAAQAAVLIAREDAS